MAPVAVTVAAETDVVALSEFAPTPPVARTLAQVIFTVLMLGALIGTLTAAGVPDNKTEAILIGKKKKTRHDPKKPKGPSKN
jgi:hypothetical protein